MKKSISIIFSTLILSLLAACGSSGGSAKVADYIDLTFEGLDGAGVAEYDVDMDEMYQQAFGLDSIDDADTETEKEIMETEGAYEIEFDNRYELSNGDDITVTVNVDEDKTDKLEGGEKEVTVEGLEEPDILSTEDVEENVTVEFSSNMGAVNFDIENNLESPLDELEFTVKDYENLENGDEAEVRLDDNEEVTLKEMGYMLEDDFAPTFEVEGLE